MTSPISTTTMTTTKLIWKVYLSWPTSMVLWLLCQGYHDYLEKDVIAIANKKNFSGKNWSSSYVLFYGNQLNKMS